MNLDDVRDLKTKLLAEMRAKWPHWKVKLVELEAGAYAVPDAVKDAAGDAIVRIEALESALSGLLEVANPWTDEEWAKYNECAKHAELILRGGEPEGAREKKNPENLDSGA